MDELQFASIALECALPDEAFQNTAQTRAKPARARAEPRKVGFSLRLIQKLKVVYFLQSYAEFVWFRRILFIIVSYSCACITFEIAAHLHTQGDAVKNSMVPSYIVL